ARTMGAVSPSLGIRTFQPSLGTAVPRQNRIRPLRGQPFRGNRPGTRGRIPVSRQGMGRGRWNPDRLGLASDASTVPVLPANVGRTQATSADSPARKTMPELARVVLSGLESCA